MCACQARPTFPWRWPAAAAVLLHSAFRRWAFGEVREHCCCPAAAAAARLQLLLLPAAAVATVVTDKRRPTGGSGGCTTGNHGGVRLVCLVARWRLCL